MGNRRMSTTTQAIVSDNFPRTPLYIAAAAVVLTIVGVAVVRFGNLSTSYVSTATPIQERSLRFEDQKDGGIAVIDAKNNAVIEIVSPGTNGFLRGALRGLARERKRTSAGAEPPFVLVSRTDGRLTLDDPTTARQVDLKSFGPSNSQVFERFLTQQTPTPRDPNAVPMNAIPFAPLFTGK
jgi:putative photosynthetic complex assembly protein